MSWRSKTGSNVQGGYTIMELFVSIAIMVVITSIVVANRNKSGEGPALKNDADLISLSIRQAQVSSISVKESTVGSGNFNIGYGVSFSMNANTSYSSFTDGNSNGTSDGVSENTNTTALGNKDVISNLCYAQVGVAEICGQQKIDISFLRPNTAAHLYVNGAGINPIRYVKIALTSNSGLTRSIYVYTSGQVSVQ